MNKKLVFGLLAGAFLGVAGCAGGIALFCGGLLATTQPALNATDEFLSLCGQGRITEAYQSTSDSLRAKQDEKSFAVQVRQLALDQYDSSLWISRSVVNHEGTVSGQFKGKNGRFYDTTVSLVKENDKWKVAKIRVETFEMPNFNLPQVPYELELRDLVKETLLQFNKAVQSGNFGLFYDTISPVWKKEITSEKLAESFKEFIENKVDISVINDLTPKFEPRPTTEENGILVVAGKYISEGGNVNFQLKYVLDVNTWKLVGINLKTGK